ncbi:hypothetical protein NN561_013087 [Cricetulus griseus]
MRQDFWRIAVVNQKLYRYHYSQGDNSDITRESTPASESVQTVRIVQLEPGTSKSLDVLSLMILDVLSKYCKSYQPVVEYLDAQFEAYLQEELKIKRSLVDYHDSRIHVCLYFIAPTGHSLKSLDLLTMKNIDRRVNIIPLIAKADSLSKMDLQKFKSNIMSELVSNGIQIYQFPIDEEDDDNSQVNSLNKLENENHCDFVKLRDLLLCTNMEDLKDQTHTQHYECYRSSRLQKLGFNDTGPNNQPVSFQEMYEAKRQEFHGQCLREEEELKQTFMLRVKEKELTFKDAEKEACTTNLLQDKFEHLKRIQQEEILKLEEERRKLEEQIIDFYKTKTASETSQAQVCANVKKDKDQNLYKYNQFGKDFTRHSESATHPCLRVQEKPHNHSTCAKAFIVNTTSNQQQKAHKREKFYQCQECGKVFNNSSNLTRHQIIHTGEKPYTCQECGKAFNNVSTLTRHQMIHAEEKPYKCKVCDKAFHCSAYFNRHRKIHEEVIAYTCKECGKSYSYSSHLNRHLRIHTREMWYICKDCGKAFSSSSQLNQHLAIHAREKPYRCKKCGIAFNCPSQLSKHRLSHTVEKLYKCEKCGKGYNCSSYFNQHQRLHTRDSLYKCKVCGKVCNCSSHLIQHQWVHTGEKLYRCEECGKSFNCSSHLHRHQLTHTRDKPYQCQECNKAFKDSSTLSRHERIHTGEKPYRCKECGKTFNNCSNFTRHQRTHT